MKWTCEAVGDLAIRITKGTTPTTLGYSFAETGIPYVRVQNLVDGKVDPSRDPLFIDDETHKALQRSQIQRGDLLISIAGTIGRAAIVEVDRPLNCNQAVAIIRLNGSVERYYVLRWLATPDALQQMNTKGVTGTITNLSLTQIKSLQIPLPPLPEQKRIAAILEAADALRAKRRETLAQLDVLLQSTFIDMFGDPVTNPKGWVMIPFEKCCGAIFKGAFDLKASSYRDAGIPFIRIADIQGRTIDLSSAVFIDEETHEKYKRSELTPDDIVFSKVGTIDRIAVIPHTIPRCNCSQNNVGAKLKSNFLQVRFALALLTTPSILDRIRSSSKKAVQDKLVLSELRRLPIIQPPFNLQNRFATIVESIETQKTRLRAHLAELDTLFASLQSRAFNGEL